MQRTIKIITGQSLLNIALQEYGTIAAAVAIAQLNDIAITDMLDAGTEIKLPEDAPVNQDILSYFKEHKIKPATAMSPEEIETLINSVETPEGSPPIIPYDPAFDEAFG